MMDFIEANGLQYNYQISDEDGNVCRTVKALNGLDLRISSGEFIAVVGSNGSGKSTFARHINALLHPSGGTLFVNGLDVSKQENYLPVRQTAGMIFQNPDNQLVAGVVEEDVAFGPENIGIPTEEIERRVSDALSAVDMSAYRFHSPNRLSGGQKQRVAIAGVLAMKPQCIVFDESTSMLDPVGRREILAAAHERNRKDHVTIIWITHFMEEVIGADRVYVVDHGRVALSGTPREVFAKEDVLLSFGLELPPVTHLANALRQEGFRIPDVVLRREQLAAELVEMKDVFGTLSKEDDLVILDQGSDQMGRSNPWEDAAAENRKKRLSETETAEVLLEVRQASYVYDANSPFAAQALHNVDLQIRKGSFHTLVGPTGSGKSTLVQMIGGLQKPDTGGVYLAGQDIYDREFSKKGLHSRLGLLFQYPEYQLFESTVLKDVAFGPHNLGLEEEEALEKAKEGLRAVGVEESFWEQSPFELSGGEKRRVAIAGVLAMEPEILVMDEPTAGLDPAGRRELFALLDRLHEERGLTILLVSHNMEEVAAHADMITMLYQGTVQRSGTPEEIFREKELLEQMNLTLPEAAALAQDLRECGLPVKEGIYTLPGLREEVRRVFGA